MIPSHVVRQLRRRDLLPLTNDICKRRGVTLRDSAGELAPKPSPAPAKRSGGASATIPSGSTATPRSRGSSPATTRRSWRASALTSAAPPSSFPDPALHFTAREN
jgi:hypothetical protein